MGDRCTGLKFSITIDLQVFNTFFEQSFEKYVIKYLLQT